MSASKAPTNNLCLIGRITSDETGADCHCVNEGNKARRGFTSKPLVRKSTVVSLGWVKIKPCSQSNSPCSMYSRSVSNFASTNCANGFRLLGANRCRRPETRAAQALRRKGLRARSHVASNTEVRRSQRKNLCPQRSSELTVRAQRLFAATRPGWSRRR